jgi:replicative DNA helicase
MNNPGRVAPQDTETERTVLGSCMLSPEALDVVISQIDESYFYSPQHQVIYKAIIELNQANIPIDLFSLTNILQNKGVLDQIGGEQTLHGISNEISSSANVAYHCGILREKMEKRRFITIGDMLSSSAYENIDTAELAAQVQGQLQNILDKSKAKPYIHIKELVPEVYRELDEMSKNEGLTGIDTGYERLNYYLGGWKPNKLIIIAGKTSYGKSALAVNCAVNVAKQGKPVGYFTLEMSALEIIKRMVCGDANVDTNKMGVNRDNKIMWKNLSDSCSRFSKLPVYIDETPAISIDRFGAKARQMVKKEGIELLFVDYMQLMSGGRAENRQLEVSNISRGLQRLSRELSIPIVALSQFSRGIDNRDGEPRLSDLRESGALEQDADVVLFINRPENNEYNLLGECSTKPENIREIIIAKNRGGPQGRFPVYWRSDITTFFNVEYQPKF